MNIGPVARGGARGASCQSPLGHALHCTAAARAAEDRCYFLPVLCRFSSVVGGLKDSFQTLGTVVVVAQAWPQQDLRDAAQQDLKLVVEELREAGPAGQQQLQVCCHLGPGCSSGTPALASRFCLVFIRGCK